MSRPLVTVRSLLAQVSNGGAVEIPPDALITPAAAEWLAGNARRVRRPSAAAAPQRTARLHLVGDSAHPMCRTLLPMLERALGAVAFSPCHGRREGLIAALRQLCSAVAECPDRRGVVLVREGAIAVAIANRHPRIRAAVVSRPAQLVGLMRELGLNVMVIEQDAVALQQARGMIESFVHGNLAIDPLVAAALADQPSGAEAAASPGGPAGAPEECRCNHAHR